MELNATLLNAIRDKLRKLNYKIILSNICWSEIRFSGEGVSHAINFEEIVSVTFFENGIKLVDDKGNLFSYGKVLKGLCHKEAYNVLTGSRLWRRCDFRSEETVTLEYNGAITLTTIQLSEEKGGITFFEGKEEKAFLPYCKMSDEPTAQRGIFDGYYCGDYFLPVKAH